MAGLLFHEGYARQPRANKKIPATVIAAVCRATRYAGYDAGNNQDDQRRNRPLGRDRTGRGKQVTTVEQGEANLQAMFRQADCIDRDEGEFAYNRYHKVMHSFADLYGFTLEQTTAAFVSLSPNNDYNGNLRSLASCLRGVANGRADEEITVSTYKHCRQRALKYLRGEEDFLAHAHGRKVTAFYHNIVKPFDGQYVTVDGHMSAAWHGQKDWTMKEAKVSSSEYREITNAVKRLAFRLLMVPNQYQAVIWFTRKRTLNIKYDPQGDLMFGCNDWWRTLRSVEDVQPFPYTQVQACQS
jgi:hypothetical protein